MICLMYDWLGTLLEYGSDRVLAPLWHHSQQFYECETERRRREQKSDGDAAAAEMRDREQKEEYFVYGEYRFDCAESLRASLSSARYLLKQKNAKEVDARRRLAPIRTICKQLTLVSVRKSRGGIAESAESKEKTESILTVDSLPPIMHKFSACGIEPGSLVLLFTLPAPDSFQSAFAADTNLPMSNPVLFGQIFHNRNGEFYERVNLWRWKVSLDVASSSQLLQQQKEQKHEQKKQEQWKRQNQAPPLLVEEKRDQDRADDQEEVGRRRIINHVIDLRMAMHEWFPLLFHVPQCNNLDDNKEDDDDIEFRDRLTSSVARAAICGKTTH